MLSETIAFLPVISVPSCFQPWRICRQKPSFPHPPPPPRSFRLVFGSSRNPGRPRAPIWKGRVLSNEAMRIVQELKRANACGDGGLLVSDVLKSKAARLLKPDMMAVLGELRRQNECELMLKVFDIVKKEYWYQPEESLFTEMIITLARNNLAEEVEKMYSLAISGDLKSITRLSTEVIRAQLGFGNIAKSLEVYNDLKKGGFFPCDTAYGVLREGLEKKGEIELAASIEEEYKKAIEKPVVSI